MDREVGEIEKKRLILALPHEIQCHGSQAIGKVLVLLALDLQTLHPVRRVVSSLRAAPVPLWDLNVKPLIQRTRLDIAKVPFTKDSRTVALCLEGFRQGDLLQRQSLKFLGAEETLEIKFPTAREPIGKVQSTRVLAGHDACSRGRTDVAGRVGVRKANPLLGETINVRRLVEGTAKTGDVPPAHIVDQK